MPLLPFPDATDPIFFVNPEHITALTPAISRGLPASLHVRIKALGLSELNVLVGTFETHEEAQARWHELTRHLGNVLETSSPKTP